MKRLLNILVFFCLLSMAFAQEETRVVDSLLSVVDTQEGREKVKTMIELTWEFYDVSYDDCISWGERAIEEAKSLELVDLEAKANYVLGIQYSYHGDLDLAKQYLMQSYDQFISLDDTKNAFESLWNIATYEMTLGSIDTAYQIYERALDLAVRNDDNSACAFVNANMGMIRYKQNDFDDAASYYKESIRLFRLVKDEVWALREESYLATIFLENGQVDEAQCIYWKVMPRFESMEDNYRLFLACKNMGSLYESYFIDYDSALYYFQRSVEYAEKPMPNKGVEGFVNNDKSSAIVGRGNVMVHCGDLTAAVGKYMEALHLAEERNYQYGQMEACFGLVELYSQIGQAAKALHYYERYAELEKTSGITLMRPSLRKYLAMDYARLGRFDDLYVIISEFEEENTALIRENADIYSQLQQLKDETADLLSDRESQSAQIQTFQTQRNHYRLAFFGLLAIVLSASVLFVLYKIVRKKRSKV